MRGTDRPPADHGAERGRRDHFQRCAARLESASLDVQRHQHERLGPGSLGRRSYANGTQARTRSTSTSGRRGHRIQPATPCRRSRPRDDRRHDPAGLCRHADHRARRRDQRGRVPGRRSHLCGQQHRPRSCHQPLQARRNRAHHERREHVEGNYIGIDVAGTTALPTERDPAAETRPASSSTTSPGTRSVARRPPSATSSPGTTTTTS